MEFVNLTRRQEIGANSYLLRLGEKSVILDSGLHPKEDGYAATPDFTKIPGGLQADSIIVTHAHQDHIGSLPFLTRKHPNAPVLMTDGTHRIGDIMLHNSVNVMLRKKEAENIHDYPLFTHRGVELSRQNWLRCPVRRPLALDGERAAAGEKTTVEFFDAGHILGSAGVLIRHEGRSLFYTGDVHFDDQTIMQRADFPTSGVDVLVMETTRGDSPTPPGTRAEEEARFGQAVLDAFAKGSAVTIPVFALGKTQELLAMLWKLRHQGTLPSTPTYIGGLSTKITEVYDGMADTSRRFLPDLQLLQDVAPYVVSGNEIDLLKPRKRCIFAISSGMMSENTLSNIFARRILEEESQHLFFVGYSDPESPAGRIRAAKRGEEVVLSENHPPLRLNCQIDQFNFSAHSPRDGLRDYAIRLKPKKIVLIHGDVPAIEWFKKEFAAALPDTELIVPEPGVAVSL